MHRKNIGGFFIHPMPEEFRSTDFPAGMPGYLSEEYFRMVRYAVECAAQYDMNVWLYDEGGWPSGTLNGKLLQEYPRWAMRSITIDGEYTYTANRPDLLDKRVTKYFLENVHEKYKEYTGGFFGTVIPGIFTDEPFFGMLNIPHQIMFSPVLEERFNAEKHYDAKEAAIRILKENDPLARKDYNEIWLKLIVENYLSPIKEWCHSNQLLFTGHFNGDDGVTNMVKLLGSDIFQLLKELDVPGCDAIWRQVHVLTKECDYYRITSSAAGNKAVLSESFAVYGPDLSLAEMKQISAMQFVAGLTLVAPMALYYSSEGSRYITTLSHFFYPDPRWEYFDKYCSFISRMSAVFDKTQPVVKCSIPFPKTALQRGECKDEDVFSKGLLLAEKQITYDYQRDVPPVKEEPEKDIYLKAPCPALRTRHLRSMRGERRIFVNSGTETIHFSFTAPDGFNAWYDPAEGIHFTAEADENNFLSFQLPFAGCIVLLTVPGRGRKKLNSVNLPCKKKFIKIDLKFKKIIRQQIFTNNGLTEVSFPPQENNKSNAPFCGIKRYEAIIQIPEKRKGTFTLPGAKRAMCELYLNGKSCGAKIWAPYEWDLELAAGENIVSLDIATTADEIFSSEEYQNFLKENHFDNKYLKHYLTFTKLFPDENILENAGILL